MTSNVLTANAEKINQSINKHAKATLELFGDDYKLVPVQNLLKELMPFNKQNMQKFDKDYLYLSELNDCNHVKNLYNFAECITEILKKIYVHNDFYRREYKTLISRLFQKQYHLIMRYEIINCIDNLLPENEINDFYEDVILSKERLLEVLDQKQPKFFSVIIDTLIKYDQSLETILAIYGHKYSNIFIKKNVFDNKNHRIFLRQFNVSIYFEIGKNVKGVDIIIRGIDSHNTKFNFENKMCIHLLKAITYYFFAVCEKFEQKLQFTITTAFFRPLRDYIDIKARQTNHYFDDLVKLIHNEQYCAITDTHLRIEIDSKGRFNSVSK